MLCDRANSYKKKYFRLDIVLGKLSLSNFRDTFTEEDKLALKLKNQYKEYEHRVSLAMIPFYEQRQQTI